MADETPVDALNLYADLATIEAVDQLSFGEHHVLLERLKSAFPDAETGKPDDVEREVLSVGRRPKPDLLLRERLEHLHSLCQRYITAPLDGAPISGQFAFRLSDDGRRWLPVKLKSYDSTYAATLMQSVAPTNGTFPFRRCPECRRVFVPRRENQKFCTPTCTAAANERLRRDHRREKSLEDAQGREGQTATSETKDAQG